MKLTHRTQRLAPPLRAPGQPGRPERHPEPVIVKCRACWGTGHQPSAHGGICSGCKGAGVHRL